MSSGGGRLAIVVVEGSSIGSKVCGTSAAIILDRESEPVWYGPINAAVFG